MTPGRGRYAGCCGGGVNAKQITALIRTARSRINLASEVISDSRRRVAVFHGHTKATPGTRVAAIRAERRPSMADDPTERGSADRDRINIEEDYEVRDWAKHFGVSEEELRKAVEAAGPIVKNVERHLRR